MKPERWQQLGKVFHGAVEHEPDRRAAFLDDACAGDQALRREVEELLVAHEAVGRFIETPAMEVAARGLAAEQGNSQAEVASGETVSHYRIISPLGSGGMGDVYLAQDLVLSRRQVALKLLPAHFSADRDRLRRFQQEAQAASALNHPNITTIFEIGESAGRHFIVTEFIDGQTLRQYASGVQSHTGDSSRRSGKQLRLGEILNVAIQAADALSAAHEAGIVHRDIKPENIMVRRRDSYVKVLDFGLAKLMQDETVAIDTEAPTRARIKTSAGVVMGTPSYMSPEQARGEQVDARTDIWSLGVVLYELVAGCAPFERATHSEVIALILEREPPPLARFIREVPSELERIVNKALTKDRAERYQTAKDLQVDLRRLRQQLEIEAALERVAQPENISEEQAVAASRQQAAVTTAGAATVATAAVSHSTGSTADVVNEIKLHKRGVLILFAVLFVAGVGAYFGYSRYAAGSKGSTIRRVAVLPFANKSGNPDVEYLSDGISESLINSLAQLPGVTVVARSSSFKYKGKEPDPQEVAKALGVDAILTGRLSQLGDNLLISAELVDARDKTQVWGEQYNRKASDVLRVQSEISQVIAQKLRLRLTPGEQQQITKSNKVNPQAYDLLLKARSCRYRGDTENRKKAIEYYQQAIAIDPTYALAYADLAGSYGVLINSNLLDPKEFAPKAEAAARKAIDLDESLPEAHLALASVKLDAWDWAAAEKEIQRAMELNPNFAPAHRLYAMYLRIQGRREQAVAELNRVRELDPLSYTVNDAALGSLKIFRQNDQALELAKKLLELDPTNPVRHMDVGGLYARLGRYREAIAAYQQAIKLGDESPDAQIYLAITYAEAGDRVQAREIFRRLETGKEYVSPVGFATIQIALGEYDQAFGLLETAYAAHDQQLIWLRGATEFDPVRSDPRFADLMRRIGLDPKGL